jgi:hypothetical protein
MVPICTPRRWSLESLTSPLIKLVGLTSAGGTLNSTDAHAHASTPDTLPATWETPTGVRALGRVMAVRCVARISGRNLGVRVVIGGREIRRVVVTERLGGVRRLGAGCTGGLVVWVTGVGGGVGLIEWVTGRSLSARCLVRRSRCVLGRVFVQSLSRSAVRIIRTRLQKHGHGQGHGQHNGPAKTDDNKRLTTPPEEL